MQLGYLVSVLSNRLGILVLLVLVANILSAEEVSEYTLSYTNALIVLTACGYWVISFALRLAGQKSSNSDWFAALGRIYSSVFIALALVTFTTAICVWLGYPLLIEQPAAVAMLAAAMLLHELQLSILNGQGRAREYTQLSLLRAAGMAILCAAAFTIPLRSSEILLGLAIVTALPIVSNRASRDMLKHFSLAPLRWESLRRDIGVGILGTLHFGTYVFVNAPMRNAIAYSSEAENLGYFITLQDLLWGPLAMMGAVISISHNRALFDELIEGRGPGAASAPAATRSFVSIGLAITMPYVVGGLVVVVNVAGLLIANAGRPFLEETATLVVIANAMIQLLFVLNHIFFVRGHMMPLLVTIAIPCLAGPVSLTFAGLGENIRTAMIGQIAGLTISLALSTAILLANREIRLDWGVFIRSAAATAIMFLLLNYLLISIDGNFAIIFAIVAGACSYFIVSRIIGLKILF